MARSAATNWVPGYRNGGQGPVRRAAGSTSGPPDQYPVPGPTHRGRRSASVRVRQAGDCRPTRSSASTLSGKLRRSSAAPENKWLPRDYVTKGITQINHRATQPASRRERTSKTVPGWSSTIVAPQTDSPPPSLAWFSRRCAVDEDPPRNRMLGLDWSRHPLCQPGLRHPPPDN